MAIHDLVYRMMLEGFKGDVGFVGHWEPDAECMRSRVLVPGLPALEHSGNYRGSLDVSILHMKQPHSIYVILPFQEDHGFQSILDRLRAAYDNSCKILENPGKGDLCMVEKSTATSEQ